MLVIFLFYAIFSSTWTVGKALLSYSQPAFFIGTRMALSGILILAYLFFFRRHEFTLWPSKHRWAFAQVAIIQIFFGYVLEYWAMQYVASSKVALLFAMTPFFSALFSYRLLNETLTRKKLFGLFVGFMGMLLLILSNRVHEGPTIGSLDFVSWTELALLVSIVCYAYGWVVKRTMVTRYALSPFTINGVTMLYGGILALLSSPFVDVWNPGPVTNVHAFIPLMILIIIIGNLFGLNMYAWLLKHYSATMVAFVGFTDPLYVAFYSWLFLGEQITSIFFVAFAIIACGLYIFYQEELRQGYVGKAG